jgi:hypothetical protein
MLAGPTAIKKAPTALDRPVRYARLRGTDSMPEPDAEKTPSQSTYNTSDAPFRAEDFVELGEQGHSTGLRVPVLVKADLWQALMDSPGDAAKRVQTLVHELRYRITVENQYQEQWILMLPVALGPLPWNSRLGAAEGIREIDPWAVITPLAVENRHVSWGGYSQRRCLILTQAQPKVHPPVPA